MGERAVLFVPFVPFCVAFAFIVIGLSAVVASARAMAGAVRGAVSAISRGAVVVAVMSVSALARSAAFVSAVGVVMAVSATTPNASLVSAVGVVMSVSVTAHIASLVSAFRAAVAIIMVPSSGCTVIRNEICSPLWGCGMAAADGAFRAVRA